jgi:ATP:ADP antiporter, AAA family
MSLQRLLSPLVEVRKEEGATALLMFAYSFLAMTAYNAIKPLTRSKFISDLGAENIPYVLLASGFVIGILMTGYAVLMARLPRRWALSIVQAGMAAMLLAFWFLFQSDAPWVSVAFYLAGQILGLLLISQFWTVANIVYDPRQAKRLFGFIGGGAPLGGVAGSAMASYASVIGSVNLLLPSAALMLIGAGVCATIIRREDADIEAVTAVKTEKGVGMGEAFDLLRRSRHLQIIALVISFAAIGAGIIEQQLNMAAAAAKGAGSTDSITAFLAQVGLWTSVIGFVIQVWLTSKIHRYLGIGFALMILPVSLGTTAVVMLLNAALWAPGLARVLDQSLRYTVDKTTREILFLPLPGDIKMKAKSFVDVTVDRGAKAVAALLLIVLVQPWGLNLDWQHLSYASLVMTGLWIGMSLRARKGYLQAFRQSIERRDLAPAEMRLSGADLSTVETLVQELAHPDPARVVYAIDVLESLDKRNLVTPLLLHHESSAVRRRALVALAGIPADIAGQWTPQIRRTLADPDARVRAAAISALAAISREDATAVARPLLNDPDPRLRTTAAIALAGSADPADVNAAEDTILGLLADTGDGNRRVRRDVAAALRHIPDTRFRRLLIPLLNDPAPEVADEAMESVRAGDADDVVFVPALVSLLRHRVLKGRARATLVGYGEPVIDVLAHFLADPDEDVWVRRHIPGTLAQLPSQRSVEVLVEALRDPDGFLRYKAIAALGRLRRTAPALTFPREPIEARVLDEGRRYFNYLSLYDNLVGRKQLEADTLLTDALEQKMARTKDRVYRLLALLYPWKDVDAVEWTLQHGDTRSRASASEYLDNILGGQLRKRIMPMLEDMPMDEKVRRGNVLLRTRPRDVEETLLQLINDDDQVVAAAAIDVVCLQARWTLADDIEHVLAHRDVKDWYVFEAASWALAEQRMPAERRRELWREPLPAAELAGRLRQLPLFAQVSVDELFRMAGAARQVRHEPGTVLLREGAVPTHIHLLLDGTVSASSAEGPAVTIEPAAALGFHEALQGQPMLQTLRTEGVAVTLVLSIDDLRTLLADNTDLVSGLFTTLTQTSLRDQSPVQPAGGAADLERLASGGMTPIEKVLALQRVPLFERASAEEMRLVADLAVTVTLTTGTTLFDKSTSPALWLLLAGEVKLAGRDGAPPLTAVSGDTIARADGHRRPRRRRPPHRPGRPLRPARRASRAAPPDVRGGVPPRRRPRAGVGRVPAACDRGRLIAGAGRVPDILQRSRVTAVTATRLQKGARCRFVPSALPFSSGSPPPRWPVRPRSPPARRCRHPRPTSASASAATTSWRAGTASSSTSRWWRRGATASGSASSDGRPATIRSSRSRSARRRRSPTSIAIRRCSRSCTSREARRPTPSGRRSSATASW